MKKEFKIFLTFFFLYSFFIQWLGWNEESRFSLTKAITDERMFEIDNFYNQTGDRSYYSGHYFSDKDPGLSFLAAPIYKIWEFVYRFFPEQFKQKYAGDQNYVINVINKVSIYTPKDPGFFIFTSMILVTVFTSCVFSALSTVLIYKISRIFLENEKRRLLLTATYGLGTLTFPAALTFMGHATATFFTFLAFYLLFKMKHEKKYDNKCFVLSGLLVGLGIITEDIVALVGVALYLYSYTINRRKTVFFLTGLLISLLPLFLYNFSIFNTPFDSTRAYIDRNIYVSAYPSESNSTSSEKILKSAIFPYEEVERILRHLHFITSPPNLYVVLKLLIDPYRGLLFYCPVLSLSFIGLFYMYKEYKIESLLILLTFVSFLILLSMRTNWWGGYGFGNRYLQPTIPLLIIPLIYTFKKADIRLILILILISIFLNFLGLQTPEDYVSDIHTMAMKKEYLDKQNTLESFPNPLLNYYLPLFLKYGPRSKIFENLSNGYLSIDIRTFLLSKEANFPFSNFYLPFLCLIPLLIICLLIWKSEIICLKK
jgi:hypothetical protein